MTVWVAHFDNFLRRRGATRPHVRSPTPSTLVHFISTMTDATDSDDLDITTNVRRNLGVDAKVLVNRE